MKDVMVDIEALGNTNDGLIIQIGACYFDRDTGKVGDKFKVNIDPVDAEKYGNMNASCVTWWLQQSEAARKSILEGPTVSLIEALQRFHEFIKPAGRIWSHATFDFVVLDNACVKTNLPRMPFRKARDIRTLVDLGKGAVKKVKRNGTHHDALDDCIYQVKYCFQCFEQVKAKINAAEKKEVEGWV